MFYLWARFDKAPDSRREKKKLGGGGGKGSKLLYMGVAVMKNQSS